MRTVRTIGAFLRRDAQVALSYRAPFVLDLMAVAFTLVTFRLVSQLIEPDRVPGGYFGFVVVGLALTAFLQAGMAVVAGNVRQEQLQGTLETTLAAGVPVSVLGAGLSAYPLLSAALRALLFVLLGLALGMEAPNARWGLAAAASGLGSISFAGLGLIGAAVTLLIRQVGTAVAWVVSLLALLAGTFFPPSLLPGWARWIADLSPFTHALRLVRSATLDGVTWGSSAGELLTLAGLAVLYAALGVGALALALRRVRRTGAVGQY